MTSFTFLPIRNTAWMPYGAWEGWERSVKVSIIIEGKTEKVFTRYLREDFQA
jgi:hypothetical protein